MRTGGFFWSRVTATVATVGLALVGLSGGALKPGQLRDIVEDNRTWVMIALASFLIVHSYKNWRREKAHSRRLAGDIESIQSNVLHLISDLSDLVGKQYHLWVVDLYIKQSIRSWSLGWPFVIGKVLEKKLSVSLNDVSDMPARITREDELFGEFISEIDPKVWWDGQLVETYVDIPNAGENLSELANNKLKRRYGVVKIWPITDELKNDYRGILVIHAKRDAEAATAALGVLAGGQGDRLCFRAIQNIHGQLRK